MSAVRPRVPAPDRTPSPRGVGLGLALAAGLLAGAARADQPDYRVDGLPIPSVATSLPGRGDLGGHRRALSDHGITYTIHQRFDALANLAGGNRRATVAQGLVEATVEIDLARAARLDGLSFLANGFLIHNDGRLRRDVVGGINTIAAIEAEAGVRLSELWFEQRLFGGLANLRIGQLAADMEFFFAQQSTMFLQSDWATITALNLPSGAASYPLATPGVRLRFDPSPGLSLQVALYNGDPAGPGPGDEQRRNRHGVGFRVSDPPLLMAEAQWRAERGASDAGLARQVKLGGWYHFGRFDDPRLDVGGLSLASPVTTGVALRRLGTWGVYGVVEQQLHRPTGADAEGGVVLFGRLAASPAERSTIGVYADVGLTFAGFVPGRANDRFGFSLMHARFSDAVRERDRDGIRFGGTGVVRTGETNLELTYVAEIVPGWTLQPVVTRIWSVNGDPRVDALVAGARSIVRF